MAPSSSPPCVSPCLRLAVPVCRGCLASVSAVCSCGVCLCVAPGPGPEPCFPSLPQLVNITCQNIIFFFFVFFLCVFFFSSSRIPSKNSPRGLFPLFTKIEFFSPSLPPPLFFFPFCLFPAPHPAPHNAPRGPGCPQPPHVSLCWGFLNLSPPPLSSPPRGEAWRAPAPAQNHPEQLVDGWVGAHLCFLFSRKKKQKSSP